MRPAVHPFPARMAPELALSALKNMERGSSVLDPMTGSGTVVKQARELGLSALGFDLDPLAVLISKVSTTVVEDADIEEASRWLIGEARLLSVGATCLPWIDGDSDAERFVQFWFGNKQRNDIRRVAHLLAKAQQFGLSEDVENVLRISLSRIIVTKNQCASLAQDTSHSRPHRVSLMSNYDVFQGLEKSISIVRKRVAAIKRTGSVHIERGDARSLKSVGDESIDAVLTSPPYLNAIDYMRGHRLSLIWLGHKYSELNTTRSTSIGSERCPDEPFDQDRLGVIKSAMGDISILPSRYQGMIERYITDVYGMVAETSRVLKRSALATFVMGNSCLKDVYIQNSEAVAKAAEILGLQKVRETERDLPVGSRYLPTPVTGTLSKRMKKEIILTFAKV